MKKFQFSLDTVLGYKQQVLENIQNEYSALLLQVRRQEERLRQAEQRHRDLNREFRRAEAEGITVAEALRFENGLRFEEKEIKREEELLAEYRRQAEKKREELVAARQDSLSLEKLKEKKLEEYQKGVQKDEERFIDELVSAARAAAASAS